MRWLIAVLLLVMSYFQSSPSKKLSTDEKLRGFLNKSENLEEDNAILEAEYRQARERIRTSSLYGAGARYKAPKTKVKRRHVLFVSYFSHCSDFYRKS